MVFGSLTLSRGWNGSAATLIQPKEHRDADEAGDKTGSNQDGSRHEIMEKMDHAISILGIRLRESQTVYFCCPLA